MILADIVLISFSILWLAFASVVDFKTREVPDWLSYSFITVGLGVRLLHSLVYSDWAYFFYGTLGLGIMFGIASLIYYAKQWGGGDAKLLMGFGAVFATTPFYLETTYPFLIKLMINLLLAGGVYGMIYSISLSIKNWEKTVPETKKAVNKNKNKLLFVSSLGLIFILLSLIFVADYNTKMVYLIIGFFCIIYFPLFLWIGATEKVSLYKHLPVSKLTEGDWVAEEIKSKGKIICSQKDLELTKKQIAQLKKAKIKTVLIKEGIPFVPSLLLGVIITLLGFSVI